ncbi:hypothetical protein [Marinobacter sp. MBR-105]
MSLFEQVKKDMAALRKPQTTVVKVKGYELNSDVPGKSFIVAEDLLNKDDAGNPKQVRVFINDPSGKLRGVNHFANKSNTVHTEVGGLIRLDRFIKKGDDYVCRHMQRIAQDASMTRMDDRNVTYKIGFDEAWVKVVPHMSNGEPITYKVRNNGQIQRGSVNVIPKAAQAVEVIPGDGKLLDQLTAVASKAIDAAPEKTAALLLLRAPDSAEVIEITIPSVIEEAENKYRPRTKEEQMAVLPELDGIQMLLKNEEAMKGSVIEALPGYRMKVFGSVLDEAGNPVEGRVREMARETCRMFSKPVEGKAEPDLIPGGQEYALALISYEIPQKENSNNANLVTLGRVPGVTASPNAGRDITPNPFYANNQTQTVTTQAAPAAAAAAKAPAQEASAASPAAAPAAKPAPAAASGQPEEPPMPTDAELDMLLDQSEGMDDLDFDMDDIERQLGATPA